MQLELEAYAKKISTLDADAVAKELEKINKKLVVPYVALDTYETVKKDISKNAEERNRLYFRKVASETAKWVGYAIQKTNNDFATTWHMINAVFASPSINPDYDDVRLAVDDGVSFMDTLSMAGLIMYKRYMTSIANSVLYQGYSFDAAARSAKQLVLAINDSMYDNHFYSDTTLPKTWQTYYKYAMQQKACLDHIKKLNNTTGLTK